MGFYDANPTTLDQLPPEDAAKKYVEYMGGAAAVLKKAKADFDKGEYRWVAEALKHVVFADPDNKEARSCWPMPTSRWAIRPSPGPWRSVYLQGAYELRNGVPTAGGINTASPDTIKAMPPEMLFDYFARAAERRKGGGKKLLLNIDFIDLNKPYALTDRERRAQLRDQRHRQRRRQAHANQEHARPHPARRITPEQAMTSGELKVEGRREAFAEFVACSTAFRSGSTS